VLTLGRANVCVTTGALSGGRVFITGMCATNLRSAVTISVRCGAHKRSCSMAPDHAANAAVTRRCTVAVLSPMIQHLTPDGVCACLPAWFPVVWCALLHGTWGRYSAVRRQFGPPGKPEQPVLDYDLQQYRLLPFVAAAYACDNFQVRHSGWTAATCRLLRNSPLACECAVVVVVSSSEIVLQRLRVVATGAVDR